MAYSDRSGQLALAASRTDSLVRWRTGLWRLRLPQGARIIPPPVRSPKTTQTQEQTHETARLRRAETGGRIIAGITDRSANLKTLQACLRREIENTHRRGRQAQLPSPCGVVMAEQVHGTSLAAIGSPRDGVSPVSGCDGLTTQSPGLALVIRTADCLPIFVWDPEQAVVGLVHVGWRGLAKHLPMRLMSFVQQRYHSRPQDLWVGIGPAIRACCYEVGAEFAELFGPFVHESDGRRTCDLIGFATQQLLLLGVRPSRLVDCGQCTACDPMRWYSVRRDGETGGRSLAFIMIRP